MKKIIVSTIIIIIVMSAFYYYSNSFSYQEVIDYEAEISEELNINDIHLMDKVEFNNHIFLCMKIKDSNKVFVFKKNDITNRYSLKEELLYDENVPIYGFVTHRGLQTSYTISNNEITENKSRKANDIIGIVLLVTPLSSFFALLVIKKYKN